MIELLGTKMADKAQFTVAVSNNHWYTVQQNGGSRMTTSLRLLLYSIVVALATANDVGATSIEGESLVERLRVEELRRSGGSGNPIGWGLVDTAAVVGRLFEYRLPRTSFTHYQVRITENG